MAHFFRLKHEPKNLAFGQFPPHLFADKLQENLFKSAAGTT